MFEPPMDRCPVCGTYVVLTQKQAECRQRENCGVVASCPLRQAFAQTDYYQPSLAPSATTR